MDVTTCSVDGCDRPRERKTYCQMHYMRQYRTGSTGGLDRPRRKLCPTCQETFQPKYNRSVYCSTECRNGGSAVCLGCGQTFVRSNASRDKQKYCSTECFYETGARTANRTCIRCGEPTAPGNQYCSRECVNIAAQARKEQVACLNCGTEFTAKVSLKRKCCSRSCAAIHTNTAGYKHYPVGAERPHGTGYRMTNTETGWVMAHRLVVEQQLGRPLEKHERVHHKNGNRADNRPENLELWKVKGKKDPAGVRASDYHCPGCRCGELAP